MKVFLDTSVLVAVFYGDHTHHAASLDIFAECRKGDGFCGAHSLAEVYAALTRMPGKHRVSGDQVMLFIADILARLTVVALDGDEYVEMLYRSAAANIVGGALYDAILARCALKADAAVIYTWNVRHFSKFGPEVAGRIRMP